MNKQNFKTTQGRCEAFHQLQKAKCNDIECDKCLSRVHYEKGRLGWKCNNKACSNRGRLLNTDIFVDKKLELEKVLDIIYLLTKLLTTKSISLMLNVTRKTISRYKRKLRKILKNLVRNERWKLGGEGVVVEIDESKFGHRKYNRGRVVEGVWVLGLVEKSADRRVIMLPVRNRNAKTLKKKIRKYVKKGSILHSDGWKGYCGLEQKGYTHKTVNHKQNYVDPISGCHTNTIEGNWYGVKCGIPKKHYNRKGIWFYLYLFMLKRNLKDELFLNLIKNL